jgi:hypothetical protein
MSNGTHHSLYPQKEMRRPLHRRLDEPHVQSVVADRLLCTTCPVSCCWQSAAYNMSSLLLLTDYCIQHVQSVVADRLLYTTCPVSCCWQTAVYNMSSLLLLTDCCIQHVQSVVADRLLYTTCLVCCCWQSAVNNMNDRMKCISKTCGNKLNCFLF